MTRALLFALPISLLMWAGLVYAVVTIKDMVGDSRYWPIECPGQVCTLTGLGGIVSVWTRWSNENAGKAFIVEGICASACEIVYQQILDRGDTVRILHGAQLIVHAPEEPVWK